MKAKSYAKYRRLRRRFRDLREEAERRVEAIRGSRDVPGFDACVRAELALLTRGKKTLNR